MELRCKNVVAGDSHGDFLTVERRSDGQVCFCRFGVIAVNKIKPSTVGDTVPHGMFAGLRHLIPAHLRNFEACTGLIHTVGSKANDVARENPQALPLLEMELHHAFFENIMVAQKLFDYCAGNCV